ncbi:MAG: peptide chain release factor 1 [Elusimicrobia bacterium CG06_land_8_20_14_3_00_38_11]|nr:MAG: peptide chain release factor 1 [Elusimicrobia bacterium CG06_land_8_20_14_3_00_38_11]
MFTEKLKNIEKEYADIEKSLSDPLINRDSTKLRELSKRRKELYPFIEKFNNYKKIEIEISHLDEILKTEEKDLAELAMSELSELENKKKILTAELEELLKPKDPLDKKNIIIEIRAAAGGDESALFVSELYRMYTRYAQSKSFKTEILDLNSTGIGGTKEIIFTVEGIGAYGFFKYESGTHRVQRVPETEASGRIHTSTVTVAVLVEPEDVDVEINSNDLRIDTYRAGGHGGQYLQKTDSAVRITHIPTNTVVACQDERSQLKNKLKAMKILRARLFDVIKNQRQQKIADERKKQVGTGDRSEKIRTYNFPQDRITDHRLNENFHNISTIMDGNLDGIVEKFKKA